jgi:hypothetical protein
MEPSHWIGSVLVEQHGGEHRDEQRARSSEQGGEASRNAVLEGEEDSHELGSLQKQADHDHLHQRAAVAGPLHPQEEGDRGHHQRRHAHPPEEDREPGRVPHGQRADDEAARPDRNHHCLGESKPRVGTLRLLAHHEALSLVGR